MSEQTPDTNNGMADGQDPSMEDILASIRKIIAEDDGQGVALDEADVENAPVAPQDVEGDLAALAHVDTLELDTIIDEAPEADTDIDALLGDMDDKPSDALEIPSLKAEAVSETAMDDVLDLEIPMDEPEGVPAVETVDLMADGSLDLTAEEPLALEGELDDLIADMDDEIISRPSEPKSTNGLMGGAMAALGLGGAAAAAKASVSDAVEPPEDDLSLMLDNMLEDSDSYKEELPVEEVITDSGEDLLAEFDLSDDAPEEVMSSKADPDMDLVKSLMADLTEEPLHDDDAEELEVESEIEAESEIETESEIEAEAEIETKADLEVSNLGIDDDTDESSEDVMDEILSMTLDDETKLSEEIAIPEVEAPAIVQDPAVQDPAASLSLKEIAAQAEADAQSSDSLVGTAIGAATIGGAAIATGQDEEPELDTAPDEVDSALSQLDDLLADDTAEIEDLETETHTPESNTEETPKMARAKKSDAIIDDVTETATAGAFASLTNVVEEKATVAERGDRIGDLVQEALRPMLKEWLDANLKGIVERAVTKEVKRISSGK